MKKKWLIFVTKNEFVSFEVGAELDIITSCALCFKMLSRSTSL